MQNQRHVTILLIMLPLSNGCFSQAYVPNRPPASLITHQGELSVSGGIHFPSAGGFDYEAVYAPWDHISTYAAFQFDRFSGLSGAGVAPPTPQYYNNRFGEIGLGYFDSIHWAQYEAYLIAGLGTGSDRKSDLIYYSAYTPTSAYTDTASLSVFRLGIQQNIGIEGSVGSLGVGLGLGYEHLFNLNRNVTNYQLTQFGDSITSSISTHETTPQSAFYAEPIVFISLGAPIAVNSVELFRLHFLFEFWWTYRTDSYASFGSGNESITLSLDF